MQIISQIPEKEVRRSLRYSIYDGAAFAVMDGLTASFITPFAVALKASVHLIAALTYVPQLASAFAQLFAAKILEVLKDRRKILLIGSFVHAILWIPLLLIPYVTPSQKYLLIVYITIQSVIANLANPIWNSLMGDIIPVNERGRFFGLRNKVVGLVSFISAIVAGLILHKFEPNPFVGFTILFVIALFARILTGIFRSMMANPEPDLVHAEKFSIIDFVKRMDKTNYGHFVMYISLLKFAVSIASPFFVVYMLRDLNFGYFQFTAIIATEMIASFLSLGAWGNAIDKKGTKFVLYVTGLLTPLIPFLWLFSSNFYYLIALEFFSGVAWSGFNLSASNFIFDAVKPENRVRCIAYYKFFESIATFLGALLGGFLIQSLPKWVFISSIPLVFLISGILRLAASISLLPMLKEARLIELDISHSFFKRYLTIRPQEGIVFEVIGKYNKMKEKVVHAKNLLKPKRQISQKKVDNPYNKKLLNFISKNIGPKEEKNPTNLHDVEKVTEDIEKGKFRK